MTKLERKKAWKQHKKEWQSIQKERELTEGFGREIVRYCSLAKNGYKGKGAVKSQGKITVRHLHDKVYQGGSRVFSQQDGWHSARSWLKKRKYL